MRTDTPDLNPMGLCATRGVSARLSATGNVSDGGSNHDC